MSLSSFSPAPAFEENPPGEHASGRKPNRLIHEKSPYLLQHAHNPVDWFPWGEEAFEKARREGKPIFLSIGYSTCHWCHVMERESFENEAIAAFLNQHFIAIKVDREERPDVDAVYMAACQAQTGGGGWPLSAFLTVDRKPFFTGTYFPPNDDPRFGRIGFLSLLEQVAKLWKERRGDLETQATKLTDLLRSASESNASAAPLSAMLLRRGFETFRDTHDDTWGGFGEPPRYAPKFPRTSSLDFLLRYSLSPAARADGTGATAVQIVASTLDAMIRGGIQDHLAGGFHRYSTDRRWLVPHFEKMLYDQALIARSLADAWRVTRNEAYRATARRTLDYVLERLRLPGGAFASAEDADTQGVEGKTYTWRRDEIIQVLGPEVGERFAEHYGAQAGGNFEEGGENVSVLHEASAGGVDGLAQKLGKPAADVRNEFEASRKRLLAVRDQRPQPLRDDKALAEWNGFAISALAHFYQISREAKYLDAGRGAARFLLERMVKDGRLQRRSREGEAAVDAFLEDYASIVDAFLDLYETDFDPQWLEHALRFGRDLVKLFWDEKSGSFASSAAHHEALILAPREFYDGATPSGNSVAFRALARLSTLTLDEAFQKPLARMETIASGLLSASPGNYPFLLTGAAFLTSGPREIVIAGAEGDAVAESLVREAHERLLPARVLVRVRSDEEEKRLSKLTPLAEGRAPREGKAAAYVCRGGVCKLPAADVATFVKQATED